MPSLYVHVPFCVRKCDYCAFYSIPLERAKVKGYLKGLDCEIRLGQQNAQEEKSTLFIGGGTPTALSELDLDTLLTIINHNFRFADAAEKTVEANPGTLTAEKLHILHRHGINRISLGVQSFQNSLLKDIGRIHGTEDIQEAVRLIRQASFTNLNLDLIFGLPGQTLQDWQNTLEKAVQLRPEHMSVYGLMLEEGTPLANNKNLVVKFPDDEVQAQMYDSTRKILLQAGYGHYETSNYALPGYECRHNLGYWLGEEYRGLGPGAVSCLKNRRWKNVENLTLYEESLQKGYQPIDPEEDENLTLKEKRAERIILGLRLAQGIDLENFKEDFGEDLLEMYPKAIERYLNNGVLYIGEGKYLKINSRFWFVANGVLQEFV